MFVLLAHISVVPGREASFERGARELAAATLGREQGIRRYEYLRLSEPGTYLATLAFADYDAFIEHQASEHHVVVGGEMGDSIASLRLERVDPVPGCSPLDDTGPDGTADVATDRGGFDQPDPSVLAARGAHYRERYPSPPAGWWAATS